MTLSPESLRVDFVIADVVPLVEPLAATRSIAIEVDLGDVAERHLLADIQRLKQVLLNLLSNAIKYNRDHGRVTVSAGGNGDGRLYISVRDTGHGVAPGRLETIFEPFERLDADQTQVEGTGLGLALSRRLAEAMAGSLTVESEPGVGSTFTVDLPGADPPGAGGDRQPSMASVNGPLGAHTLVYIEDNLSNLRLVEEILAGDQELTLVASMLGKLGLELAYEHRPSLVLLDLNLPDLDGRQVLRTLKNDPRTSEIPVIVLSADATPRKIESVLDLGASAYITKPIDVQEFRRVIHDTLTGSGRSSF
jgi:CheY-like chemotaxis protein/anti-sigma regulatory factor (Ser/Thr protein kinase)